MSKNKLTAIIAAGALLLSGCSSASETPPEVPAVQTAAEITESTGEDAAVTTTDEVKEWVPLITAATSVTSGTAETTAEPPVTVTTSEATKPPVTATEATEPPVTQAATQAPKPPVTTTAAQTEPEEIKTSVISDAGMKKMLKLVNEARAEKGLAPMKLDPTACKIAQLRAEELVKSFSHTRPDGSDFSSPYEEMGVNYKRIGENIAYGMNMMSSVRDAFESWMASDGHRANILDSNFDSLGVGMYAVKKNGAWYYYWCQTFAVYN